MLLPLVPHGFPKETVFSFKKNMLINCGFIDVSQTFCKYSFVHFFEPGDKLSDIKMLILVAENMNKTGSETGSFHL